MALLGLLSLSLIIGRARPVPAWTALAACHQPCWAGLNPDVLTAVKARRILEQQPQFAIRSNGDDLRSFDMLASGRHYTFVASVEAGQDLTVFHIVPHEPISVGEVIAWYGAPDYFYHYEVCNDGHCTDNIYLWFPKLRIEAIFQVRDSQGLRAEVPLSGFVFGQLKVNLERGCPWRGLSRLMPRADCYLTNR